MNLDMPITIKVGELIALAENSTLICLKVGKLFTTASSSSHADLLEVMTGHEADILIQAMKSNVATLDEIASRLK
jgi:hypothetical protein